MNKMLNAFPQIKPRGVIYCRVSSVGQVEDGNSLKTQERLCYEYAAKYGIEIVKVFIEKGESAKTAARPELQDLLKFCSSSKNKINCIIAYKIDRISRNMDDYSYLRLLLKSYGVEIKSTSEHFENTPAGRFMENIIANVAQFDNDVRTERSIGGMKEAIREGRYVWRAPLGYKNVKLGGKHTIVPSDYAKYIKRAFELVSKDRLSTNAVRLLLRIPNPNGSTSIITTSYFYKILRNEIYAGWIIKFGERHKGQFEQIVSQELFNKVQNILNRQKNSGFKYQLLNEDFPLRRFVSHPNGNKLTGSWSKGRNRKYAYYRFSGLIAPSIDKIELENKMRDFMNQYRWDRDYIDLLRMNEKSEFSSFLKNNRTSHASVELLLKEVYQKRNALIQKNLRGIIQDSVLKEQLDLLEKEEDRLHEQFCPEIEPNLAFGKTESILVEFLKSPGDVWYNSKISEKVPLQWFQFPQGITFSQGRFRTAEVCRFFKLKSQFHDSVFSKAALRFSKLNQQGKKPSKEEMKLFPPFSVQDVLEDAQKLYRIFNPEPEQQFPKNIVDLRNFPFEGG